MVAGVCRRPRPVLRPQPRLLPPRLRRPDAARRRRDPHLPRRRARDPGRGRDESIAAQVLADRSERPWPLVGLGLAGVALAVLLSHGDLWPAAGAGWILVLIAGLTILWASRESRRGRRIAIVLGAFASLLAIAVVDGTRRRIRLVQRQPRRRRRRPHLPAGDRGRVQPAYELGVGNLRSTSRTSRRRHARRTSGRTSGSASSRSIVPRQRR